MDPMLEQTMKRIDQIQIDSDQMESILNKLERDYDFFIGTAREQMRLLESDVHEYKSKMNLIKEQASNIIKEIQTKGKIEDITKISNAIEKLQIENLATIADLDKSISKIKNKQMQ